MTAPALAPTARSASYIGARRARVTRLDRSGRAAEFADGRDYGVCSGFVSVEIGPEVEEGEDYTQKTAGGDLCISEKGQDNLKWFTVKIEFCKVDPDMFTLMNPTWKVVKNARGEATGFRIGQKFSDQDGFALELWPKVAGETDTGDTGDAVFPVDPNGYFLLPFVLGTAPDSWTLENGAATFSLQGRTRIPARWGYGPWAITRDAQGHPSPLINAIEDGTGVSAMPSIDGSFESDMFHSDIVSVSPPRDQDGAQPLRLPHVDLDVDGMEVTLDVTNIADITDTRASVPVGSRIPVRVFWDEIGVTYEDVPVSGTVTHTYTHAGPHHVRVMSPLSGAVWSEVVIAGS